MSEEQTAVKYLKSLSPGFTPKPIFDELSRISVLPCAEFIPVRLSPITGKPQVLLTQRPADDKWWPGVWHNPGTVILASDQMQHSHDYSAQQERIFGEKGELAGSVREVDGPHEIETERRVTNRGHEIAVIFYVKVEGEPTEGKYFDIDSLPENTLKHQIPTIKLAGEKLVKNQESSLSPL